MNFKKITKSKYFAAISGGMIALFIFLLLPTSKVTATTETFSTAVSTTWTAPAGVFTVQVECWGAGGAGGAGINSSGDGGNGGGAGAYARVNSLSVVPGNSYNYVVGTGGIGNKTGAGPAGTDSTFNGTSCVAKGGNGGLADSIATTTGGLASGGTGDVKYDGGDGAGAAVASTGGGGGGGATSTTAGNYAVGQTGGASTGSSGAGGNGGASGGNGVAATGVGAGGGGSGQRSGGAQFGGNGTDGQIQLTYTADVTAPTPDPLSFTFAPTATTTDTIYMESITATDPTAPVEYYFTATTSTCGADIGTGGTDSAWQTATSHNDVGLQVNKCYGYEITARDGAANYTATSSASTTYTYANAPGVLTYSNVSTSTITITNDENGNPVTNPATTFAVYATSTDTNWDDVYVTSAGATTTSQTWLTDAQLDSLKLTGFQLSTEYFFEVVARNEDGVLTASSSITSTTTTADITAPTPNPPSFSSAPANDAPAQLAMTSITVTDDVSAIPTYYFTATTSTCGADIGTGGTDSAWQAGTGYTDTGLQPNQCYGYEITTKDDVNNKSATSTASVAYTTANTPGTPTFSGIAETTVVITNAENSNPAVNPTTQFAVMIASSTPNDAGKVGQYITAGGGSQATAAWLTDAQIDSLTVTGLSGLTTYSFQVMARNGDNDETASSTQGDVLTTDTTAPTPNPVDFEQSSGTPTDSSISQIDMTSNTVTDPSSPVSYLFTSVVGSCGADNGTGGTNSAWQSADPAYSDTGLQTNKCYGYTITTQDSLANTSSASAASSTYTAAAVPGTPTLSSPTETSLVITNAENSNPAVNPTTQFAVMIASSTPNDAGKVGQYITAGGGSQATPAWLTDAQIDSLTVTGLSGLTTYSFQVMARNGDNGETASSTQGDGLTTDTTAPTPNPVDFEQSSGIPTDSSISQIDMTSNTVTDPSSPVSYLFTSVVGSCGADNGTGGTNSAWQSADPAYSDTGLQTNKCYGYTITTQDSLANTSSASAASSTYTAAAVPGALSFSSVAGTSFVITNAENGNPAANPITTFAVYATSSDGTWDDKYVDSGGNPTATKTWLTDAQIDGLSITGLQYSTEYRFVVLAQNGDGDETASSTLSATTTLADVGAPTPNPVYFEQSSGIPTNFSTSQIDMTSNTVTDPSSPVEYYFTAATGSCGADIGTGGTNSGWQSADPTYSDAGLQPNQCYGYEITARDALGNAGATSTASSTYTSAAIPGVLSTSASTQYTMTLLNNENSNPSANPVTYFAVYIQSTSPLDVSHNAKYVDASGAPSAVAVWMTDVQIDGLVMTGLEPDTTYTMQSKARNEDSDETGFGSTAGLTTGAAIPSLIRLQNLRIQGSRLY